MKEVIKSKPVDVVGVDDVSPAKIYIWESARREGVWIKAYQQHDGRYAAMSLSNSCEVLGDPEQTLGDKINNVLTLGTTSVYEFESLADMAAFLNKKLN